MNLNVKNYIRQLQAVKRNGWAIRFIDNPSHEIQLNAVKQNGGAIQYIDNPSHEIQMEAVKQNGYAIKYIDKSSYEIQMEAVEQHPLSILFIKNPYYDVIMYVINNFYDNIKGMIDESILEAIKNNDKLFLLLNVRNEELIGYKIIKFVLKGK